ncbi:MAG: HD domain-containing protein [Chitinophagaceae bacterium]|nr:HD domain-containing protein [Chitinophagaceae bacterium]
MYNKETQERVANYVTGLFDRILRPELVYHNLVHTQDVVKRTKEIATFCSLNSTDMVTVIVAAWFHDCGHLFGPVQQHEERSVVVMRAFLAIEGIEDVTLQLIEDCILATRFPYEPKSLVAEILCDADSYHLGTNHFLISDDLVKKEFELIEGTARDDWDKTTLFMLEKHHFFTTYCRELLKEGKQKNIDFVRTKVDNSLL